MDIIVDVVVATSTAAAAAAAAATAAAAAVVFIRVCRVNGPHDHLSGRQCPPPHGYFRFEAGHGKGDTNITDATGIHCRWHVAVSVILQFNKIK